MLFLPLAPLTFHPRNRVSNFSAPPFFKFHPMVSLFASFLASLDPRPQAKVYQGIDLLANNWPLIGEASREARYQAGEAVFLSSCA